MFLWQIKSKIGWIFTFKANESYCLFPNLLKNLLEARGFVYIQMPDLWPLGGSLSVYFSVFKDPHIGLTLVFLRYTVLRLTWFEIIVRLGGPDSTWSTSDGKGIHKPRGIKLHQLAFHVSASVCTWYHEITTVLTLSSARLNREPNDEVVLDYVNIQERNLVLWISCLSHIWYVYFDLSFCNECLLEKLQLHIGTTTMCRFYPSITVCVIWWGKASAAFLYMESGEGLVWAQSDVLM